MWNLKPPRSDSRRFFPFVQFPDFPYLCAPNTKGCLPRTDTVRAAG